MTRKNIWKTSCGATLGTLRTRNHGSQSPGTALITIALKMTVIGHDVLEVGIEVATCPPPIPQRTVGTMAAPAHAVVGVLGTTPTPIPAAPLTLLHALVTGTRVRGIRHAHAALSFSLRENDRGRAFMLMQGSLTLLFVEG